MQIPTQTDSCDMSLISDRKWPSEPWKSRLRSHSLEAMPTLLTNVESGLQNSSYVIKRFKSNVPTNQDVIRTGQTPNNFEDSLTSLESNSKIKIIRKKSTFLTTSKLESRCQSAGQRTKRGKKHVVREPFAAEIFTKQCESAIHFKKAELKRMCSTLHEVQKSPGEVDEKFTEVIRTNINRTWSIPSNEHTVTFITHPGYEDTLDEIELTFKTDYVDENFHMVGYLERLGSDNFLMVDDAGKVYRAAGDILYVVGKNLFRYLTSGPVDLGHYDYYRRLTSRGSLECIGWTECKVG